MPNDGCNECSSGINRIILRTALYIQRQHLELWLLHQPLVDVFRDYVDSGLR